MARLKLALAAALLAGMLPVPAPAATQVVLYRTTGTVSVAGEIVRASAQLRSVPVADAPWYRGVLTFSGVEIHPPSPCHTTIVSGALSIIWADGLRSRGTGTLVLLPRLLVLQGHIKSGRFQGALLETGGLFPPNPCDRQFSGTTVLVDAT